MIDREFYKHIRDNLAPAFAFKFGSAEGEEPPYCVMFKVVDLERPITLFLEQGDTGKALFQFSLYAGSDATNTVYLLEAFKRQVALIKGNIGTETIYRIYNNITSGVVILREGASSLNIWGAMFECEIWWEYVSSET